MLSYPKGRYNQMNFKNIKKVMAGTVAGAIMVSAAACTPISTKAQWSYKEGKNEKAIGVYIFALFNAYNQAKTYAEKADGYKKDESFLDLKIKDDDGKEAVASDWIKDKADLTLREALYLDSKLDSLNATVDEASYAEQAEKDWTLGYMAEYTHRWVTQQHRNRIFWNLMVFLRKAIRNYSTICPVNSRSYLI